MCEGEQERKFPSDRSLSSTSWWIPASGAQALHSLTEKWSEPRETIWSETPPHAVQNRPDHRIGAGSGPASLYL